MPRKRATSRCRARPENICAWQDSRSSSLAFAQLTHLLLTEPAACLFAQITPDLGHVSPKRLARDDLGAARARQGGFHPPLHLARTIGHHRATLLYLHRLGGLVGSRKSALPQPRIHPPLLI